MKLRDRIAPFFGRRCTLRIDAAVAPSLAAAHGETWELFLFDWDATPAALREEIHERSNQDACAAFAIVAPRGAGDDLATLVAAHEPGGGGRAGTGGFLLFDEGDDAISVGDGDLCVLTRDLDAFVAALAPIEG